MNIQRLLSILEELEARSGGNGSSHISFKLIVLVANSDLVALLLKRDQLLLEHDSLKMEIEDILKQVILIYLP